jgi:hypothetical protein
MTIDIIKKSITSLTFFKIACIFFSQSWLPEIAKVMPVHKPANLVELEGFLTGVYYAVLIGEPRGAVALDGVKDALWVNDSGLVCIFRF